MSDTVIQVENLSKQYRLGEIGTGALSHDLKRWWYQLRGKPDPFAKVGEVNDRATKANSEYVWALKDINFEVKQGEVLGIIGKNGAGKSTLLKILSKTTAPTTGNIKIRGRIASLLEVGTGFHPELSGRDNIFLNGAILGMTKKEIRAKFDEIVEFSGVERYIDTPVKRYSSGMYVRLAFAVAAHLEPDILIIDEVLAVGDAEFQAKCLGKMKDVSERQGRTVIFVSHNMSAMRTLCSKGLYFNNGSIVLEGEMDPVIEKYLSASSDTIVKRNYIGKDFGDEVVQLLNARLLDSKFSETSVLDFYGGGSIEYTYQIKKAGYIPIPNLHLYNINGDCVMIVSEKEANIKSETGIYQTRVHIPPHFLNDGRYIVGIAASTMIPERVHFFDPKALIFDIVEDMEKRSSSYRGNIPGIVRPELNWSTIKLD